MWLVKKSREKFKDFNVKWNINCKKSQKSQQVKFLNMKKIYWENFNASYNKIHYNKKCPCTPNEFTGFWVNSLVIVNGDQWKNNEFSGRVNGD
jgi:hypothetical protein